MDGSLRGGRDNVNCQCQCHFPPGVICHITCCCHCMNNFSPRFENQSRNDMNNTQRLNNPYQTNQFSKNQNENFNPMNSCSTNFKSIDDSYIDNKKNNYYSIRKQQEQKQRINTEINNNNNNSYTFNNSINNNNCYFDNNNNPQKTYTSSYTNTFPNVNNQEQVINSMNIENNPVKKSFNDNNQNDINFDYQQSQNNYNQPNNNNNNINNIAEQPQLDDSHISHIHVDVAGMQEDLIKCRELISSLKKENESLKAQRDSALNQLSSNQNSINVDRVKFDELEKENFDLRNRISDLLKKNKQQEDYINDLKKTLNDLDKIIHDKEREIQDNLLRMRQMQQDYNNQINMLKNKIDELNREKDAMYRDFMNKIKNLMDEIKDLKNKIADLQMKIKELEDKLRARRKFDEKREKLLDTLFNWYNNMNRLLNTNTFTGIAPPKEILNDVLNLQTPEEFNAKLEQIEEKLKQFIEDMKMKFGQCFACDIACCTSEVDRLKYFRHYYPGPPKDYLERKKSKSKPKTKI